MLIFWGMVASSALAGDAELAFSARPAPGASASGTGEYFDIEARAGSAIDQSLVIKSFSPEPVSLRLSPVDAGTGATGGIVYALERATPRRVGAWLSLERRRVTLVPGASVSVPFTVAVPPGAESGLHIGGIAVSRSDAKERRAPRGGASIDVEVRRVVPVVVTLPGRAVPRLDILGVRPVERPEGINLLVEIENDGTDLTTGEGVIMVREDGFRSDFFVDDFVPHTDIEYPIEWKQEAAAGEYKARVEIRYGSKRAIWRGPFTVDGSVVDELEARGLTPPVAASSLPWLWIAAAGGVTALLIAGLYAAMRRFRRPAARKSPASIVRTPPAPPARIAPPPPPAR
ncbi:MAG: WxL protein peptidoglycan domain-containing protein [Actinomycetota bacterium]